MYFTSCNIFENIYLPQKAKKTSLWSFWLSSTGAVVLLRVPPSMLIPPLYLNLGSKEISREHISFPYICFREIIICIFMFLWITILSKIPWADNLSCHYILGTLGFTLRKSLPPAAEMTSLWSFLQWPSSRTSSPVLWPLTDSNQPLTLDNAWGFLFKVTNAIWSTFGIF